MPPKKKGPQSAPKAGKKNAKNNKTVDKAKQKIVEDKTFGLKNKNKSKKVQNYVQQVQQQVNSSGTKDQKRRDALAAEKKKKFEDEKKNKEELSMLFKAAIVQPKVPLGVDPKSIVCEFFKNSVCMKGARCKFSHDLQISRKVAKKDVYTDVREEDKQETMEEWGQDKLEEVVNKKQGNENANLGTKIVCKYFLEAVESGKYGWFWECQNGKSCQYKHCLPPGFVLKKKNEKPVDEEEERTPLEELLEIERGQIKTRTPITFESFMAWKKAKAERKAKEEDDAAKKRKADFKAGKSGGMSGREMFVFNPELFQDDQDALDDGELEREENDEDLDQNNNANANANANTNTNTNTNKNDIGLDGDKPQNLKNENVEDISLFQDDEIQIGEEINENETKGFDESLFDEDLDDLPDE